MKRYYKVERFGLGHNHVDFLMAWDSMYGTICSGSHRAIDYKTWRNASHAANKANKYFTKRGWNFRFCVVAYLSER